MTVQNTIVKNVYVGNGSTTVFPFTFECNKAEHIQAFVKDAAGNITSTTNFKVDLEQKNLTYPNTGEPLANGDKLIILRQLPLQQLLNLLNQGPFYAEDIEETFDEVVMMLQQMTEHIGRSLAVSVDIDSENSFNTIIPLEAGKTFRVKNDGTGFEVTEDPGKVIDGAKALLKLTTEQAEFAKEQADASSQSAVSAQNAADAAEAVAPEYAKTKEVLDNIVSYTNTATEQASIATAKADAANASATNAAQSYANADGIATQLTEYLATKETLTAPAVDKTLLIEGAAADSKVVGVIKSDLSNYLPITWIDNSFIEKGTGAINSATTYMCTDYIQIVDSFKIIVKTIMKADYSALVFYDEDKKHIQSININNGTESNPNETIETILDVPQGTKYIRFSLYKYNGFDTKNDSYIKYTEIMPAVSLTYNKCDENLEQINNIKNFIPNYQNSIAETSKIDGFFISKTMTIYQLDTYFYTELYELKKGDKIRVESADPSGSEIARVSKWDKSGMQAIEVLSFGTKELTKFEYTATEEVEYLRFCGYKNNSMDITLFSLSSTSLFDLSVSKIVQQSSGYFNYWAFNLWKILCIGDSLTSGANYAEEWGELAPEGSSIDQNYPRILGRMLNAEVTNGGKSGYSASDWYLKMISQYDLSKYDTFIIWLGTNNGLTDTLDIDVNPYTDYNNFAETETGYYCKIIEKIKADNPSCLIILTKIFASKGNYITTNIVIDKIAAKYNLPVIDNSDIGHRARPDLHANVANPHFGKAGNIFIANRFVEELGKWFEQDHLRSEYGYSPRTN